MFRIYKGLLSLLVAPRVSSQANWWMSTVFAQNQWWVYYLAFAYPFVSVLWLHPVMFLPGEVGLLDQPLPPLGKSGGAYKVAGAISCQGQCWWRGPLCDLASHLNDVMMHVYIYIYIYIMNVWMSFQYEAFGAFGHPSQDWRREPCACS